MTDIDLDELDREHHPYERSPYGTDCDACELPWPCTTHLLVAEVRRLREQLKTVEADNAWYSNAMRDVCDQRDDFLKRAEAAEARIAAATASLNEIICEHAGCEPDCTAWDEVEQVVEALTGETEMPRAASVAAHGATEPAHPYPSEGGDATDAQEAQQ